MATNANPGGGSGARRPTLLFVCIANVCRSPTMQFLTGDNLSRLGIRSSWTLASAGTTAHDGEEMCPTMAQAVRRSPRGRRFVDTHRARPLELQMIEDADLILVATHSERPQVTRLSPDARTRTFTMVEAALLAEAAVSQPRHPWSDEDPLGGLLANMHAARGSISSPVRPTVGQRLLRFGHVPAGMDVADVHTGSGGTHRRTLADLRWASAHLAESLAVLDSDLTKLRSS